MPDPIHTNLADLQSSLTQAHTAESRDGSVRAEATAKHQTALHLTPGALRMSPTALADLILTTQREAQEKAQAALTEALDTFKKDPRVTTALESLQDTQANPGPPTTGTPTRRREEDEETFVDSVYNSDGSW